MPRVREIESSGDIEGWRFFFFFVVRREVWPSVGPKSHHAMVGKEVTIFIDFIIRRERAVKTHTHVSLFEDVLVFWVFDFICYFFLKIFLSDLLDLMFFFTTMRIGTSTATPRLPGCPE